MQKIKNTIFCIVLILYYNSVFSQELIVYNTIPDRFASDKYYCKVRKLCSDEWYDAFVLQTISQSEILDSNGQNGNGYVGHLNGWTASWISFEFSETAVEVEISKVDGTPIQKAFVRPEGKSEKARIANGKAYVILSQPTNINVDIDGQMEDVYTGMGYNGPPVHTISIFANPVFKKPNLSNNNVYYLSPNESINDIPSSWDTIYFAPGVHHIGTPFQINSYKTLYIPGNAVVHGTIHPPNLWGNNASHDWSVYGSGALSGEEIPHLNSVNINLTGGTFNKTFTYQAHHIKLEGFVVVDPAHHTFNMNSSNWDTTQVNIYKNLKILGWRLNSDAINAFRNSSISGCFFRCQDDVFYYGGDNVKISNCVTWNDFNGSVLYVTKGASTFESSYFKDVNVIYHRAAWHYWNGGRIISFRTTQTGSSIKNVQIKNVKIEDPLPGLPPFYMTLTDNNPSTIEASTVFENVVIDNVVQPNRSQPNSWGDANFGHPRNTMLGYSGLHKFSNFLFKNCYYDSTWIGNFIDGDFLTNAFVENVQFILNDTLNFSLDSFQVHQNSCNALLSWNGLNDVNIDRYEIEKSLDGENYLLIGQLTSIGNTNLTNQYSYLDTNLQNTSCFYRLKIIKSNLDSIYNAPIYLCFHLDTVYQNLEVCDSVNINNSYYSNSGNYLINFLTNDGCDSLVNLNLTVNSSTQSFHHLIGLDSVIFNNQVYYNNGNYFQYMVNQIGCDSILNLEVEIATTALDLISNPEVLFFPNPTKSVITLKYPLIAKCKTKVYDIFGKEVFVPSEIQDNNQILLDFKNIQPGKYEIKIFSSSVKEISIIKY